MEMLHRLNKIIYGFIIITFCRCSNNNISNINTTKIADTLCVDLKDAAYSKIKHGTTDFVINYGGPNVVESFYFKDSGNTQFKLDFGNTFYKFPSVYSVYPSGNQALGAQYYFYENTGIIATIKTNSSNNYKGKFYKFDEAGNLKITGYYNGNDPVGIWRRYDNNGALIKIINADTLKSDILESINR